MENYPYNNNNSSSYPESADSSPLSREIEFENPPPWEDSQIPPNYSKVKFMCSYGGKIHPRPHDNLLSYIGGETKILSVDRNIRFASLLSKLVALCDGDGAVSFKYQLPGEDLDALISVTNDDDLEHMMSEYDRLFRVSPKPARLRIFVFHSSSIIRSFGSAEEEVNNKSDKEKFVDALNSAPVITNPIQDSSNSPVSVPKPLPNSVDFLFGFEKSNALIPPPIVPDPVPVPDLDPIQKHIHDLQRLRLEEQTNYRRKSNDYLAGGEFFRESEKSSPVTVQYSGGVYNEQQQPIYMIPPQASGYHAAPMMRQVAGAPSQGYYAVQRMQPEVYREHQQMYNVIPQSQKVTGYSEGTFGMQVRPVVTESAGYAQVAYDRQVIYNAPGGVMGTPAPVQYQQAMAAAEGGGSKVISRPTHTQM